MTSTSSYLISSVILCTFILLLSISSSSSLMIPNHRRRLRANPAQVQTQLLAAHNAVRKKHKLPPLTWSTKLANYAKWYGNQRRNDCRLVHSTGDYGENIFWGQGQSWNVTDAVRGWAVQEGWYNYGSNSCMTGRDCLHYTQLVWRSTKQVGCARVKCRNGDTYVVCEYYPHGNVVGQRPY
ncbi:Pathogenesis-related protein PR-1 [Linum perenne]